MPFGIDVFRQYKLNQPGTWEAPANNAPVLFLSDKRGAGVNRMRRVGAKFLNNAD
jgi:hypothetical protein